MANDYFHFKQFTLKQGGCAFKIGTDGVILGAYADVHCVHSILDIGSGTCLIALMLAQRSNAAIFAIEPDVESFAQMAENVSACKWSDRINIVNTRLQDYHPGIRFDLIVSNPPYFTRSLRNPDARKSYTRHDDSLPHRELLECASDLLAENGKFQVIMPLAEGRLLIDEAISYGLYCSEILNIRPAPSSEIIRVVITFSLKDVNASGKYLITGDGRRTPFTEEYRNLTEDFYIKF